MKLAYSYQRFSTVDQSKGDSLNRQLGAAKKWCEENGYVLSDKKFFDPGKSGYKGEHLGPQGQLKRFIDLVHSEAIKPPVVLIIDDYSRFSRLTVLETTKPDTIS